jgi:tetratricopeptide (TPR) repeat protein
MLRTHLVITLLSLLAAAGMATSPLVAQHGAAHTPPPDTAQVPLYSEALGSFTWPISTASTEAQAYFDQGTKLMYAFARDEARRSFAEARTRDPTCAMCWWGEAWAMGAYLNGPMRDADAPAAHAAAQRARELAATRGTPTEQALTEAMTARYRESHGSGGRRGLDSAFAATMERVYEQFPSDLQVAALYADAMMLLEPRRGTWSLEKPSVARIHVVLERGLAADLAHPGVCHAYIHATESTPNAGRAQQCADLLVNAMPGASHLNHMPSHTYNRVGRWADAVESNVLAWQSDQRAAHGQGISIYPGHNLHMLLFAASVDGQEARALEAADAFAALVPNGDGASLQALTRVRFGRFRDVLALTAPPQHAVHRGLWTFARGYAYLRTGQRDSANAYLARVDSLAQHTPENVTFRGHTPARLLGVVGGILRGELLRTAGRRNEAIAVLEQAVVLEDGLTYDEPEPLPFAARDWLGATLLQARRAADAERVYRAALEDRPHNGWSLFGLEQAVRTQRKRAEADQVRAAFQQVWARSKTVLPSSRF